MEKKIIALIADSNLETCEILNEALSAEKDFKVVGTVGDGRTALELIKRYDPDIVIMDFNLKTFDGIQLLEQLQKVKKKLPEILITTAIMRESVLNNAMYLGASYIIQKPFDVRTVIERARQIVHPMPKPADKSDSDRSLESIVSSILIEIGVPVRLMGYGYLRDAIILAVNDMEILNSMTKALYPTVAAKSGNNWKTVERDMRSAIDAAWDRGDMETLQRIFGYTVSGKRGKPTNSEFIALIADKIYLEQQDKKWREGNRQYN